MKVKESVEVSLRGILKENKVTLDVTSAWKSREALKVKESIESQGSVESQGELQKSRKAVKAKESVKVSLKKT